MPQKVQFYGSIATAKTKVLKPHKFQDMESLTFKCISGARLIRQECALVVADTGLHVCGGRGTPAEK